MAEQLAFVGAGVMAEALARAVLTSGRWSPQDLVAADVAEDRRRLFAEELGTRVTADNGEAVAQADIVVVAVKPQVLPGVLGACAAAIPSEALVISIAAGVTLAQLAELVGAERPIVRAMPNTAARVGRAASAYATNVHVTGEHRALVVRLFGAAGMIGEVEEKLLNAITGLSGSGPAFVFLFIEALADGGVAAGLARKDALPLAAQTVLGAAEMVVKLGRHPGELKDEVCSPGGTTIAGVRALEAGGFRGAVMEAVLAAWQRARELSGE